jgi:hypothetical protein
VTNEARAKALRLCCLDLERQARRLQSLIREVGLDLPVVEAELETLRSDLKVIFALWCDPDSFMGERVPRFDVVLRVMKATYKFEDLEAAIYAQAPGDKR